MGGIEVNMENSEYGKRLQRLEDIQTIKDLHREYIYWVNECSWDKVIDCFTDDCNVNIGKWGLREGKASLQKLFKQDIGGNNQGKGRDGHFATQPVITVSGDKATGHWLMYIVVSNPENGLSRCAHGRHDVEYARVNGEWKIRSIVWTNPWPREPGSYPKID
jgi:ketosteroid isomerase-like protein